MVSPTPVCNKFNNQLETGQNSQSQNVTFLQTRERWGVTGQKIMKYKTIKCDQNLENMHTSGKIKLTPPADCHTTVTVLLFQA